MSGLRLCDQGHANPLSSRYCNQCGAALDHLEAMTERVVGDRYRILREIGHGGFGRTYLAEDINRFSERCVLKELAPAAENQDSLDKAKELFAREAEVLYKLQHPQIPKFREWFIEPTRQSMFLVQDYVEGPTYQDILRDRIAAAEHNRALPHRTFAESEVITLLTQILPVLSYIHGRGVIHRDLSPDNLICRNSDRLPVLIDFGGVKEVTASSVNPKHNTDDGSVKPNVTLIGKPGYSPEEQMRRGQVTPGSDLYALGVTALVLLIGEEPSEFYDAFHLKFDWHNKVKLGAGLNAILEKMTAYRTTDRYSSAEQVLQDLSGLSSINTPQSAPQPDWTQSPSAHWATPVSPAAPVATMGTVDTVVVAPLGTAVATAAAMPVKTPRMPNPLAPQAGLGIAKRVGQGVASLVRSLLTLALLVASGFLGWSAVRAWLQPQPFTVPQITPSLQQKQGYSADERQRKAQLLERLDRSGVASSFFYRLVNEAYYLQYPNQRGRLLGSGAEDEPLRRNWDQVAVQVLNALDNLSPQAREQLGRYTARDRAQWSAQLTQAQANPPDIFNRAATRLQTLLPMYQGIDLQETAAQQVVDGLASDQTQQTIANNNR
ncbi:MAG TPA: serine/threonine-protein kinase [Stenomitos sp.]